MSTLVYLIPPVPSQEPSWRLRVNHLKGVLSSQISDKVAKVFADSGVPVIRLGVKPTGATQGALILALDGIRHQNLKVSERVLKAIEGALSVDCSG